MKVLFIHNRYQQKGGEDTVFEQELELMGRSEEVKALVFQNFSGWRGAFQFVLSIWNIASAKKIRKAIEQFQPDVIHVHNWHYAIGPLVVRAVYKKGIPIVLTVQNFRLLCPSATLLYKGKLFTDSLHASFPWRAIRNKVYRNSFLQTFWLSFFIRFHRMIGTWNLVDRYILQTELAKQVFLSSSLGVKESQFSIKPNFIEEPVLPEKKREDFFLFIGRLAEEKGIEVLLDAFKNKKAHLYIGGDGPLKESVLSACKENPNLHYAGLLDTTAVKDLMCRCSVLIFPSIWYEGMPMTLIEAFAAGTPVIASNLGAMASMIQDNYNGLHFTAGDAAGLSGKIDFWQQLGKNEKKIFSDNARRSFTTLYTPEVNRKQSLAIYQSVIENKSRN